MGLSGGVDSTVAATILHKAIGDQLICFFIDNGLLRKYEFEEVLDSYHGMGLNVVGIDAKDRFYTALTGLSEPEAKRKAIIVLPRRNNDTIEIYEPGWASA